MHRDPKCGWMRLCAEEWKWGRAPIQNWHSWKLKIICRCTSSYKQLWLRPASEIINEILRREEKEKNRYIDFFFRRISWRHFIYLPCPTWKVISATRNYSTGNGCRQAVIDIQSNDWELSAIEYEKKTITESISNFIWPEHALGYEIVIYLPAISLFPFCVWYDQLQHIDIRWHHIVWLVLICTYSQRIRTER